MTSDLPLPLNDLAAASLLLPCEGRLCGYVVRDGSEHGRECPAYYRTIIAELLAERRQGYARLAPHYARCVEALDDLMRFSPEDVKRWPEKIEAAHEALAALHAVETEEGRRRG